MVRIPSRENLDAYDQVFARRSALGGQLRAMRAQERTLVERWLQSGENRPQPVSTDKLMLRLRLDEGGGDVLKNSAPNRQPASFPIGKSKPQWGETTWLWPDFRMDTSTHIVLGQTGDLRLEPGILIRRMVHAALGAELYGRQWVWCADLENGHNPAQSRLGYLHRNGVLSVHLVNESPSKEKPAKQGPQKKEEFHYPAPADLTAKELAPNKPPAKKEVAKKVDKKSEKPKPKAPETAKDKTPRMAIEVSTVEPLPLDGAWRHVFFTYDGSGSASGVKIYINGSPVATRVVSDTLGRATIRTKAPMQLGWRYPDASPSRDTRYQDVRLYGRALAADEVKRLPIEDYVAEVTGKPTGTWNDDQWHAVSEFYLNSVDPAFRAVKDEIAQLNPLLDKLSKGGAITMVAWERPSLAYADVLTRGVYTARIERVEANTPHFLPPLPAGMPHNRLALAKWVVSPENPLTARVTVNRMWYEIFGTGIVETTEDFGIMGQRPSDPELLDWLAVEFRESGWNIKHMYKLMVMSAAYRQSAKSTPDQLARDPKNLLLSHGPRFRMDAEMLRDIALQSGGLLVNKIGGPSVKPYQPPNVWEQVSYPTSDTVHYVQDHGAALYRRSMYTYWKRMAIMPDMDAFDAPMRDVVCTRRQRTDTPLQALVTMDDVQWVEAARALAQRVIREGGRQPVQRIDMMSEILLAHDPSAQMAQVLKGSLMTMEQHYAADPKAALALVRVGETKPDPSIPAPDLAAWTMVASEMLNLDQTVNK